MTFNFASLTLYQDKNVFNVERQPLEIQNQSRRSFEAQMLIEISFSQEMKQQLRIYFNFVDAIGTIGGMLAILNPSIKIWLSMWNFRHMDNYMVSQRFRSPPSSKAPIFINGLTAKGKPIIVKRYSNILEYFLSLLPAFCRCCKKSRKQRRLEKARALMNAEINLIEMVKARRYF